MENTQSEPRRWDTRRREKARRLDAVRQADRQATCTPARTPRTRRHRRSHGLQERHRDRPGQRDRRRKTCRASTSRPTGSTSWCSRRPLLHRAAVHARPGLVISEIQVLMAMMAIKGIYAEYQVQRLNHGIGFDTAAIELLLPTYGEPARPEGQDLPQLGLNPHPALIPRSRPASSRASTPSAPSWAWKTISAPGPTSSSRAPTARCAATAPLPGWPATTPATCSSARRCRSTAGQFLHRHRTAAFPASAARRTWAHDARGRRHPARPG
jgi:hypothetical protein